ncbi:MAG TPA: hypothetical protein VKF37_16230 [Chloroflexota bacterium]|nr:hypothetical protein [Chloroflexota bacterium]
MRAIRHALAITIVILLAAGSVPAGGAGAPDPTALLLAPADLPPGYVRDDALENADATARSQAYADLIVACAFRGYRTEHAAVVQYVARLQRRADATTFLAGEGAAVAHSRDAQRLTLPATYGDAGTLAYQARGSHGAEWTIVVFAVGSYVTMLGAYDAAGEQAARDQLQHLAVLLDARLRAAAALAPDPTPTPAPRVQLRPALRILTLATSPRSGHPSNVFQPHSAVYWRVVWRVGDVTKSMRETLREWVWHGRSLLYSNGLTDRPFSGDNALIDHLQLGGAAAGSYSITVSITIGRLSARATRSFQVAAARSKGT